MRKLLFVIIVIATAAVVDLCAASLPAQTTFDATTNAAIAARDRADTAALGTLAANARKAAAGNRDFDALLRLALFDHWLIEAGYAHPGTPRAGGAANEEAAATAAAVGLRPQSALAHARLGTALADCIAAQPDTAMTNGLRSVSEFAEALRLDPKNSEAMLGAAIGTLFTPPEYGGDVNAAIAQMRQAEAIDPDYDTIHIWLAQALLMAKQPAAARTEIKAALALDPNRIWAKSLLGQLAK